MKNAVLKEVAAVLDRLGVSIPEDSGILLKRYLDLVREWNPVASLVSARDARESLEEHVADSLGLAPILLNYKLTEGLLLDVGSGGGFPAIPLKVILPNLSLVLMERSSRKAAFLTKATAALGLKGVEVVCGSFPVDLPDISPQVIIARAIERPQEVISDLCEALPSDGLYLCQSGDPCDAVPAGFIVERSSDGWEETGYRRGEVYVVRRG